MRDFKKLKVWQLGMELAADIYALTKHFPKEEMYGLTSQLNRAAVSVPSNIAEGGSRISKKEYVHYLRIALGSLFELETQLLLAQNISLTNKSVDEILSKVIEEQRMLSGLIKSSQP